MSLTKVIVTSAMISSMETAVAGFVKSGRLDGSKVEAAKARIVSLEAWLESQPESYFDERAAGNSEAFKAFEAKATADFVAYQLAAK
jgi:hypothetical protein